jgi:hypothetical protein
VPKVWTLNSIRLIEKNIARFNPELQSSMKMPLIQFVSSLNLIQITVMKAMCNLFGILQGSFEPLLALRDPVILHFPQTTIHLTSAHVNNALRVAPAEPHPHISLR